MGDLLLFLALLFHCGLMPLSWDSCRSGESPLPAPITVRGEEIQAP